MKKTLFLLIAVLLLSLAFAGAASATTPFGPLKWSQPIVETIPAQTYNGQPVYNGWDQPSWNTTTWITNNPQVADDWECKDNRPVTDIHWWGSYLDWIHPTQPALRPSGFWFGMYTDVPAPATGGGWSHPGDLIWGYNTALNGYEEVFVGYDKDPRTGLITDSTFQYNVTLPTSNWFSQDPSRNSIYWLSIVALYPTQPEFEWGWKTRPHFFQDDAVTLNATGGWDRVGYLSGTNDFQSWDTAFELSTVPEPSGLVALAAGLPALVGLAIRKRYRA